MDVSEFFHDRTTSNEQSNQINENEESKDKD